MADALSTAVHNLESLLHPTPLPGYKVRFWAQVVLNSILLLICIIYLIVAYAESRRLRKPLALLRIQRVASGRFVVVNALVLLVLFDGFAAGLMLLLRWKLYTIYFGSGNPRDKLVIAVQGWSPITLVAWAYSFGNIAAMMQIKTRDFGGPSKRAVFFYNLAFVSSLVIAFGLGLPFCLIANSKMDTLISKGEILLEMVHQSQATRTPLTPSQQQIIKGLLLIIKQCQTDSAFWVRAVLILAGSISCLTAMSAAASFWFVAFLSDFPKNNSPDNSAARSPTLVNASMDHEITFLGLGAPDDHPSQVVRSPRISKTSKATFGSSRPQNVALQRLSKDLMLSVPVVLIMSVYCVILTILTAIHVKDHAFAWQEVMYDGVSWASPALILIIGAFLHNLLKYRNHNHSPVSIRGSSGRGGGAGGGLGFPLMLSPPCSPRRAYMSGRVVVDEEVKIADDAGKDDEEYKIGMNSSDSLGELATGGQMNTFDIAVATRGDEGLDWMELNKVEGKQG